MREGPAQPTAMQSAHLALSRSGAMIRTAPGSLACHTVCEASGQFVFHHHMREGHLRYKGSAMLCAMNGSSLCAQVLHMREASTRLQA